MSVGRPRWTSPPTCSIACRTWDARTPSASPNPGRGWGQCVHSPDPCTTLAQASAILGTIMGRYNAIVREIEEGAFGPLFWENANGSVIAGDWAEGFLHAVALRANAWEPLMRSKRHGRLLFPILALCADEHGDSALGLEPDEEDRFMAEAAELIPVCVTEIAAYWRKRRPTLATRSSQPVSVSLT